MTRRELIVRASLLGFSAGALGAVLNACAGPQSPAPGSGVAPPPHGGTYNYPLDGDPVGIAPTTCQESIGYQVARQLFEGLMRYEVASDGVTMSAVPSLCTGYSVSADGTVFTFSLRKGVSFQSPVGGQVTAADFVASWNAVADPQNWIAGTPAYILAPIVGSDESGAAPQGLGGVVALDPWTLQVTLKYPFAEFPTSLGHPILAVWPVAHALQQGLTAFEQRPIGTGPYLLQRWAHDEAIDLARNPHWWNAGPTNGPFVDTIHMPEFDSLAAQWSAFQADAIDCTSVPLSDVSSSAQLAAEHHWVAKRWPQLSLEFIGINQKNALLGGPDNLPVRQALSYAVDRAALIDGVLQGVPLAANGLVPAGLPGSDLSTLPYPYDMGRATALVQALGKLPHLELWYNVGADLDRMLAPLQADWRTAGLVVDATGLSWKTYLTGCAAGRRDQLFRLSWSADYPSIDNFLYALFQSSVSGTNSFTFYANPDVDGLLATARGTLDQTQRLQLYAEAEKMILADAPVIPLYYGRDYRIMNNRVMGQQHDPMGSEDMNLVWVAG
jgi:peptide/nickel transport system substrate-binding protein/oligopeptide transport system substrate-binding protein